MKTLKQLGFRKLGGNDIVRIGDYEWTKSSKVDESNIENVLNFVLTENDTHIVGEQMCCEFMQDYGNNIYRKLNVKK